MSGNMKRRAFITLLGGAAAWPLAARAQRALPTIGFLSIRTSDEDPELVAAFRQGLKEMGFVEGQNVGIEYRFASRESERLPALVADLIDRRVTMIAATTTAAALAAKAATTTIPIVFETASDPVQLGLVASLNRPGGNITGVTQTNVEMAPKRLELLREILPTASVMALLVNPADATLADTQSRDVLSAARLLGLELRILNASTEHEIEDVLRNVIQLQAGGLVIATDSFFSARQEQIAAMAARHAVPTVYQNRQFVAAGGLMSYGSNHIDTYRLAGVYAARIIKGEQPHDLPVQQSTRVELFLNLKTAKALGITVPLPLLGRADEVIE
jgi:putative tryptophan/tyrosine transport system substrate-binding protein